MIRKSKKTDEKTINELGLLFHSNFNKTHNINNYLNNDKYIILLNEDDTINAFCIIYKNIDYFELETIFVCVESRNKKIASSLIEFFIRNYTKKIDTILLEVAVNNEAAINLYKKFGFEIINTRKKYYGKIDAYVMKKVI